MGHNPNLRCNVSQKGALSVYGLGRFPITLYQEQWKKLLADAPSILAFIEANKAGLKLKGDAPVEQAEA